MGFFVTYGHLTNALAQRHSDAHGAMEGYKDAAVLVAVTPHTFSGHREELCFLLTERTMTVETHKGQIAFPGGSMDDGDESPEDTALRETEEEIGLPSEFIELLGTLPSVHTPSGFHITPIVGYISPSAPLKPNPAEVERILYAPVAFFVDPNNEVLKDVVHDGIPRQVPFYYYRNETIWGATAAMISSLAKILRESMKEG